jgi:hypothetical protein
LIGLLPDDFDEDVCGGRYPLMVVSAIGPDVLDEGEEGARHLQQRPAGSLS